MSPDGLELTGIIVSGVGMGAIVVGLVLISLALACIIGGVFLLSLGAYVIAAANRHGGDA